MKIESHVTSLEISKKLHELNIKKKSFFVWEVANEKCYGIKFFPYAVVETVTNEFKLYPAYIASELFELLPQRITLDKDEPFNSFTLYIKKSFVMIDNDLSNPKPIYIINYECDSTECSGEDAWLRRQLFYHNIWDDNFSNACAKMLIHLIENGYIKNE